MLKRKKEREACKGWWGGLRNKAGRAGLVEKVTLSPDMNRVRVWVWNFNFTQLIGHKI